MQKRLKIKKITCAALLVALLMHFTPAFAKIHTFSENNITIDVPEDWQNMTSEASKKNNTLIFKDSDSRETLVIIARNVREGATVEDLNFEALFAQMFQYMDIEKEGRYPIGGKEAKYCIYVLRDGDYKSKLEKGQDLKYLSYAVLNKGKLYAMTFTDKRESFVLDYPAFLQIIGSIKFID